MGIVHTNIYNEAMNILLRNLIDFKHFETTSGIQTKAISKEPNY